MNHPNEFNLSDGATRKMLNTQAEALGKAYVNALVNQRNRQLLITLKAEPTPISEAEVPS